MLARIFPEQISNVFPGHRIALYGFYLLTALTHWRSQYHIFAADGATANLVFIPLGLVLLALSLWPSKSAGLT